jgi:formylglycine-generating enzyme
LLKSIADSEELRGRWLAEVEPTKELRARWLQVPEIYRKQVDPDAEARLAEAVASESMDLVGFQVAQAAFSAATKAAGEAWLAESLVALPRQLRPQDIRVGMQQWMKLEAWFGEDPRLQPLRASSAAAAAAAAAARADVLRRSGLAAVAGSVTDEVSGFPKRVIHTKTGIELVLIPAGEFLMGSPASESGHQEDETQHLRMIRKPFYMGVTEVTQAQWRKVMDNNPSRFQGDDMPVERVSWQDCRAFLAKVGDGVRLPSEAEWEYACRAGTTTPFAFGSNITAEQANYDGEHPYAGGSRGQDRQRTVAAGSLPANAWGLHEMHGNVWEWCQDVYSPYPTSGTKEPNEASGPYRVVRGGGWGYAADRCRSAFRLNVNPGVASGSLGFRVVLAPVLFQ